MLFEFHTYFDGLGPEDWHNYAEHLTNMLEAHRKGRHIFFASRRQLDNLLQCEFLGTISLATVREINQRYADYGALRKSIPRVIEVCDFSRHAPSGTNNSVAIPINSLLSASTLEECHILVEHAVNDGEFWQLIFDAAALSGNEFPPIPVLKFVHCGGSSMCDVVERHARARIPLFCIVDSDRRSRFDGLGDTASAAEDRLVDLNLVDRGVYGLSRRAHDIGFRVLSVREAENLVPLDIVRRILEDIRVTTYRTIERVAPSQPQLTSTDDVEIWRYYDIKKDQNVAGMVFKCLEEEAYFATMTARVGDPLPAIHVNLLRHLVEYCSGRHRTRNLRLLASSLEKSPFFSIIRELACEIWALSCRSPSRYI